jgi:hypothetical protein
MFKPAYEQFAEAYAKDAVFTTIMGDANDDCKGLMTRLGVKSVPAFFFYRGGKQVAAFTGANKTGAPPRKAGFSRASSPAALTLRGCLTPLPRTTAFRNQLVAAGISL